MFDKTKYIQRREVLKSKLSSGIILFLGNDNSPVNFPEHVYTFRQHSSFLYYFGLDKPDIAAIIDVESGEELLFGDEYSLEDRIILGKTCSLYDAGLNAGMEHLLPMVKLYTHVREIQAAGRPIHFLPPYRPENKIKLLRYLNIRPDQFKLKSSEELVKAVIAQREIKDEFEIEAIKQSVNMSIKAHRKVRKLAVEGKTEWDIRKKVKKMVLDEGADFAFPVIATNQGHIYHDYFSKGVLEKDDLLLFNIGIESDKYYASDISCTYPVNGEFNDQQKEIHQVLHKAYEYGISQLRPLSIYKDVYFNTCVRIWDGLKEVGILKGQGIDAVYQGAHVLFIPFGFGHMIGLDVHDMDDLGEIYVGHDGASHGLQSGMKALLLSKELKPGFTLSFEPGIYFIPELIDQWRQEKKFKEFINYDVLEQFKNFTGMRIGENFVIGNEKAKRIGKALPKLPI